MAVKLRAMWEEFGKLFPTCRMATYLLQCQRVHEGGKYVTRLLRVGMSIVVDTRGIALYPGDGVTDDSLKKLAVGRPLLAVCFLVWGKKFRTYQQEGRVMGICFTRHGPVCSI